MWTYNNSLGTYEVDKFYLYSDSTHTTQYDDNSRPIEYESSYVEYDRYGSVTRSSSTIITMEYSFNEDSTYKSIKMNYSGDSVGSVTYVTKPYLRILNEFYSED